MSSLAVMGGLVLPIAAIGLIATLAVPLVVVPDAVMVLFFVKLWRKYGTTEAGVPSCRPPAKAYPENWGTTD
ncbi:MAG: hypothetical protein OK474_12135 [Thaumarchaeota archaeon]|nr:hypothetical protein [Nitrososphaerota archaeon]